MQCDKLAPRQPHQFWLKLFPNLWKTEAAIRRETCIGDQRSRPAGVRTPRASNSWAMAASVVLPVRRISAITVRVVALALVVCSDLAARACAAVFTLPA